MTHEGLFGNQARIILHWFPLVYRRVTFNFFLIFSLYALKWLINLLTPLIFFLFSSFFTSFFFCFMVINLNFLTLIPENTKSRILSYKHPRIMLVNLFSLCQNSYQNFSPIVLFIYMCFLSFSKSAWVWKWVKWEVEGRTHRNKDPEYVTDWVIMLEMINNTSLPCIEALMIIMGM